MTSSARTLVSVELPVSLPAGASGAAKVHVMFTTPVVFKLQYPAYANSLVIPASSVPSNDSESTTSASPSSGMKVIVKFAPARSGSLAVLFTAYAAKMYVSPFTSRVVLTLSVSSLLFTVNTSTSLSSTPSANTIIWVASATSTARNKTNRAIERTAHDKKATNKGYKHSVDCPH